MIVLDTTTDNLQIVLDKTITTNQLQCVSSWRDITTSAYTPGRTVTNTNSTTDVNIVPAPGASTQRVCESVCIYNRDTVIAQVTIKFNANGTEYIITKVNLAPHERLEYSEKKGWRTFTKEGSIKTKEYNYAITNTSNWSQLILDQDQLLNSAGNELDKVYGLSINTERNVMYYVKYVIVFAASGTGIGFGHVALGPPAANSATKIRTKRVVSATTTSDHIRNDSGFVFMAPGLASSVASTVSNIAIIEGFFGDSTTSPAGSIELFLCRNTTGTFTVKKGSYVMYKKL